MDVTGTSQQRQTRWNIVSVGIVFELTKVQTTNR